MRIELVVQQSNRENVDALRRGLRKRDGVIVLGIDAKEFWALPGLDALFLTLPRSEAWGSRPLPPHLSEVLRTRETELKKGFPPYVVTGMVMKEEDPKTGRFELPLLVTSAVDAVIRFNREHGDPIQVLGLMELERLAPDLNPVEMGELIGSAYEASVSDTE